jgi:hypothetical protein
MMYPGVNSRRGGRKSARRMRAPGSEVSNEIVGWTRGCDGGGEDEAGDDMGEREARMECLIPVKWRRAKYFVSADFSWLAGGKEPSKMVTSLQETEYGCMDSRTYSPLRDSNPVSDLNVALVAPEKVSS